MNDEEIKVSELDLADEIRDTDQIMIIQGGINKKAPGEKINDRTISDSYGESEHKGYSQKYQNEHNVVVSSTKPTTNERVWFKPIGKNLFKPVKYNKNYGIALSNASSLNIVDDEFTFVASGTDMYFGQIRNTGDIYTPDRGILIPVEPGEKYQIMSTNLNFTTILVTGYDENKVSTGYQGLGSTNSIYTVPSGCYYITVRFGLRAATSGTTYKTKFMVAKTDTLIEYEKYQEPELYVDGYNILLNMN